MLKVAALEEVAPADAIGYKFGIGVAGDRLKLGCCCGIEALVGIDHK
jgi:hypothetical protein